MSQSRYTNLNLATQVFVQLVICYTKLVFLDIQLKCCTTLLILKIHSKYIVLTHISTTPYTKSSIEGTTSVALCTGAEHLGDAIKEKIGNES